MTSRRRAAEHLNKALALACTGVKRRYQLAAVGIRHDGVVVSSRNSSAVDKTPSAHAEARLARKLTPGSIVFVARKRRDRKNPGTAKPCKNCMTRLRSVGVKRVYYTTDDGFAFIDL